MNLNYFNMKHTLILLFILLSTLSFSQEFKIAEPYSMRTITRAAPDGENEETFQIEKRNGKWYKDGISWQTMTYVPEYTEVDTLGGPIKGEKGSNCIPEAFWHGQQWPPGIGIFPRGEMAFEAGEGINIEIVGKNTIRISAAKDTINPQPLPIDMRARPKPNYSLPPDRNVLLGEGDIFYVLKNDRYEMYVINDGKPVKIKQE